MYIDHRGDEGLIAQKQGRDGSVWGCSLHTFSHEASIVNLDAHWNLPEILGQVMLNAPKRAGNTSLG